MTPPDTNTIVIVICNIIGFLIVEWRLNKRAISRESIRAWQHEQMWNSYSAMKGIGNGGKQHGR